MSFDRYTEYMAGVLDVCKKCAPSGKGCGIPIMQTVDVRTRKTAVVCIDCGQMVGPEVNPGMAMAAWNKEQRGIR